MPRENNFGELKHIRPRGTEHRWLYEELTGRHMRGYARYRNPSNSGGFLDAPIALLQKISQSPSPPPKIQPLWETPRSPQSEINPPPQARNNHPTLYHFEGCRHIYACVVIIYTMPASLSTSPAVFLLPQTLLPLCPRERNKKKALIFLFLLFKFFVSWALVFAHPMENMWQIRMETTWEGNHKGPLQIPPSTSYSF